MHWLKQSTASQEIPLGYFLDSTDGDTEETALTIANTDIKIWKTGATTLANKNSGGATHISNGIYYAVLDATDTNTLGPMTIFVHVAGALTVKVDCLVLPANVYDSLVGGTDNLEVDAVAISGDTTAANNCESFFDGTGYAGTNNVIPTVTTVTNDVGVNEWNGVALATTNPLPNAAAGANGGLPTVNASNHVAGIQGTKNTLDALNDVSTAQVNTEVDTALVDIGLDHMVSAAVVGTDITDNSIIARLVSKSATADWDSYNNTTDSLEAIRDRGDAAWVTGGGGSDRLLMVDTTIATLASQTSFTLTDGSADDDAYNNCTIVIEDAATTTQKAVGMVIDYTGSTKTVTLKEALAFTIAATDKVYILAENSLKSTVANRQLDVTANGTAGIDWGNVENQSTSVNLSATTTNLVNTTTTNTDMRGTDSAFLASSAPNNFSDLAITVTTGYVTVGTNNDKTGYTISGTKTTLDALNDVAATDIVSAGAITTLSGAVVNVDTVDTCTTNSDMRGTDNALLAGSYTAPDNAGISSNGSAIAALNDLSAAQVNAEVLDVLNVDTFGEPSSVPAATASIVAKLGWLYTINRNKTTQTGSTTTLRNDADSADIATASVSDDLVTFVQDKWL